VKSGSPDTGSCSAANFFIRGRVLDKDDPAKEQSANAKSIKQAQTGLAMTQALRFDRAIEGDVS
jgi:hypothetical protein